MRAIVRWPWLTAVVFLLLIGGLGWRSSQDVPWSLVLLAASILLFLVRLSIQWRGPATPVANPGDPVLGLRGSSWVSGWPLRALRRVLRQCAFRFEFIIFVLLAATVLYQVLLPPVLGLADNGDFGRLMDQTGLSYALPGPRHGDFDFVELNFLMDQPREPAAGYVSSELIFVNSALLLEKVLSSNALFDLRSLGALHAAAFLACLLFVLSTARYLPRPSRWIVGVLVLIVFTDVGYVAYLNSLYREPAALIFLTLTLACAFRCIVRPPQANLRLLLAYFAAAALFVTAKPEYAPQSLLLAAFGVRLAYRVGRRPHRLAAAGMAVVVCLFAASSYASQPTSLREVNLYNHVFSDVLTHSPAPEADLANLGLDRGLVRWTGTDAFDDTPIDEPAFKERFFGKVTHVALLKWYVTHPVRLADMLDRAAREGFSLRSEYLGNFERSASFTPGAKSGTFDTWSAAREHFPSSLAGLLVAFVLSMGAAALVRSRSDGARDKMLAELFILLLTMAALGFVVACLGGGALDIVKHLFVFNLLVDVSVIVAGGYLGKWWADVLK